KAFARMDGAWLGSIDVAWKKARTARYFDMETAALSPMAQPGEPLYHVEFSNGGLITFPGGIPLQLEDGAVVGAIGVSGSTVDNDQAVAEAGARAFQEALTSGRRGPASPAAPTAPRSAVSTTPTALRPRGIAAPPHRRPAAPRYRRPERQSPSPAPPTPGLFNERNIRRARVYQGPYEVAVQDVEDPAIQDPSDVIVRITTSAICGSDLHMYEGRTDAEPGITFGHENMGVIEEVGPGVTSLS